MKIENAVKSILNGEVLILPTDTLYGLAANAYDYYAVKKVFDYKKRNYEKQLPVHYSCVESMLNDIENSQLLEKLSKQFWPGALTLIVKKKKNSKLVFIKDTIAVRIPDNKILLEILKKSKLPLVMPSANISDCMPEEKFEEIKKIFELEGIEDDKNIKNVPSTIIDITSEPKLIRKGAIKIKLIDLF